MLLGREFPQGAEAGAGDEFAVSSRDPGPHGEGREVVAGQEAFAGEVAVGIEVSLFPGGVDLPQQVQLAQGLAMLGLGQLLVVAAARAEEGGLGHEELACGCAVQLPPAREGAVELLRRFQDHAVDPVVGEPGRLGEDGGEDLAHLLAELVPRRCSELELAGGIDAQGEVVLIGVDDLLDGLTQGEAHAGEPDGVDVGSQQGFVAEVEAGRAHAARDNFFPAAEEVLVVAVERAAIGEDEARLSLTSGPAAALGVVGGRGGYIAEMDQVEVGDVHAQFHGRGADRIGQAPAESALFLGVNVFPAEAALPARPLSELDHLGGMLAGFEGGQGGGGLLVEALEEGVHRGRCVGVALPGGAADIDRIERRR